MSYDNLLAGNSSTTFTPVELLAGNAPVHTQSGQTLVTGQNLAQFTVVGRITASGKLTAWDPAGNDGSQYAVGILVHATDATSADKTCQIYVSGVFNVAALVWPAGTTTLAARQAAFERTSILIKALLPS